MTDKPNSTELINMAHREWRNRQERKGHDDEVAWTSGWISGYLTGRGSKSCDFCKPCDHCDFNERDMQIAEAIMKAKKEGCERVLDELVKWIDEQVPKKDFEHPFYECKTRTKKYIESLRGEP